MEAWLGALTKAFPNSSTVTARSGYDAPLLRQRFTAGVYVLSHIKVC
jgi:hypothetical protein